MCTSVSYRIVRPGLYLALWLAGLAGARGEAMLQLFQMKWSDLSQKMPELAEAGYTSLWLPVPAKGGGALSVGYDLFDPFDLGDKNQNGTIPTKYGTKAELLQMVETAHRFGIRVYFDNIMNHRQGVVPGYDVYTPTNFFPGLWPQDFHLKTTSSGNRNWPNVENWGDQGLVQNEPINGLCDLATEPGGINYNFGPTLWSQTGKPFFVRQPGNPEYYMDTNTVSLGSWSAGSSPGFSWPAGTWHGFNGTNGQPVAERVEDYLTRAAMWTLYTTRCDGFRLDAVKHVPSPFFGDYSTSWRGYLGGIQAMYDFTHGYGNNVAGNGYAESGDNRDSVFNTETARNDAMVFGEHLGSPPSYGEYIATGMRLVNSPLRTVLNGALQGGGSLPMGLDQRDYIPYGGAFSSAQGVQLAEDHDHILCCPTHREMQNAYYFMHEGLPMIYSDNFNWAGDPGSEQTFPQVPMTRYLGQYGDNTMPETCYIHNQMARGGARPRWSDSHIVAFERYDYRDVSGSDLERYNNPDATVVLFAMNATYDNPSGDVLFDDGVVRTGDGYYNCYNGSPSKGFGLVVGFPPGSVLSQMAASSPNGGNSRTCAKLLVHAATTSRDEANATAGATDPAQRKIYVAGGQVLAPGGGAIELLIPAGGWVMYGYQWPEPSRGNALTNAITFRQGGAAAPTLLVTRRDGSHGDPGFAPVYPFKMRGSVDSSGNVLLAPGEGNVSSTTNTYAIRVPVLTNAPFDILLRSDASAANMLAKMDGGLDLNSQMGFAPATGFDRRDHRPGYASDVWLGYEQAAQQLRYGPEKFGARLVDRDTIVSSGAETYKYTVGTSTTSVVNGSGGGLNIKTQTADWVYHDPAATNTANGRGTPTQRMPYNPGAGQSADIWVKSGYQFQIDKCFIYYTTDGTNPEGAFGVGKGTTLVVEAGWQTNDVAESTIDWWKGTIPAQAGSTEVRYKVALFKGGYTAIDTISDADNAKLYGLTQFGITNFNPATATAWLHNNLNTNDTITGLRSGFHILRARAFLPRAGKSGVYNTFLQTFYYAGQLPGGVIAYPAENATLTSSTYTVVVRADSSVTEVSYCITDNNGQNCGFANAASPDGSLSQQYPNYPQEFRFTYSPVASNGVAVINVYLKDTASSVYPDRYATLTRTVNAQGPATVLNLVSPATDGQVLILNSNDTYTISACFTSTLTTTNYNLFSLYINGVFQPRLDAFSNVLYNIRPTGCGAGLRWFFYNWRNFSPGTNLIHLTFTNGVNLSSTRTAVVGIRNSPLDTDGDTAPDWLELLAGTDPGDPASFLRITHLVSDNPVELTWSSVPGKSYQVWATTNLLHPMAAISGAVIPANASDIVTRWFDSSSGATNRFYRVQVLP